MKTTVTDFHDGQATVREIYSAPAGLPSPRPPASVVTRLRRIAEAEAILRGEQRAVSQQQDADYLRQTQLRGELRRLQQQREYWRTSEHPDAAREALARLTAEIAAVDAEIVEIDTRAKRRFDLSDVLSARALSVGSIIEPILRRLRTNRERLGIDFSPVFPAAATLIKA